MNFPKIAKLPKRLGRQKRKLLRHKILNQNIIKYWAKYIADQIMEDINDSPLRRIFGMSSTEIADVTGGRTGLDAAKDLIRGNIDV